eukprot:gene276-6691_t
MIFFSFLFFVTGVYEKISKQYIINFGAGNPATLFFPFVVSVSYLLLGLVLKNEETEKKVEYPLYKKYALILTCAIFEILAQIFCAIGINHAGSLLFILFYSSLTCFIALFRYLLLNSKISKQQIFGIFLITLGIAISAFGKSKVEKNEHLNYGIICVMIGTLFYSFNYIGGELILSNKKYGIQTKEFTLINGLLLTIIGFIYMILITIPQWDQLVNIPIIENGSNFTMVYSLLLGLIVSTTLHNYTYFKMLPEMGSTNISIINTLVTIGVFILSHVLFCETMSHQCFNQFKGVSAVLVIIGVLLYSIKK